jgi:hypothetical protein
MRLVGTTVLLQLLRSCLLPLLLLLQQKQPLLLL